MKPIIKKSTLAAPLVALLAIVAIPSSVFPCSVPVFRYALERWPADDYDVVVFHEEPLSVRDLEIVNWLEQPSDEGMPLGNFRVRLVDLSKIEPTPEPAPVDADADAETAAMLTPITRPAVSKWDRELWETQKEAATTFPWMSVVYPYSSRAQGVVWAGPLTGSNARALIDSPARREVAKRLLDGQSAVWAVLECGDAAKDEAAVTLLQKQLDEMTELLELPEIAPQDYGYMSQGEDTELRLEFSILRLSKDDPAESVFANMLIRSEPDLETEYADQPMTFPILGRGRALFALVGPGINEDNVGEACAFIAGPCSCQVKDLNPGVDMLMSVDWGTYLDATWMGEEPTLDYPDLAALAPDAPPSALNRNVAIVVAIQLLVVVAAGSWVVARRRSRA